MALVGLMGAGVVLISWSDAPLLKHAYKARRAPIIGMLPSLLLGQLVARLITDYLTVRQQQPGPSTRFYLSCSLAAG